MFYSLESDFGNGCDSCGPVPPSMPQPPMMDGSCGPLQNVQVNAGQQPFNPYANSGVPQTPTVPFVQQPPAVPQQVAVTPNGQTQSMDSSAQQAATHYLNNPVVEAPDFMNTVEGFDNLLYPEGYLKRMVLLMVFGVIVALSVNECAKFYLNRAVQASEGSSYHYLSYALIAVVVVVVVFAGSRRMM